MVSDEDLSDMPCPLGCDFRPTGAVNAFRHLVGHALGRHRTGAEQLRDMHIADDAREEVE